MTTLAPRRRIARSGLAERARLAMAGLDWPLIVAVAAITAFSIYVIASATEEDVPGQPDFFLNRQLLYVAGGILMLAGGLLLDPRRLSRFAWGMWGGLIGAVAVVFVVGGAVRGSNRWIEIGSFNLQPSEFGKVVLILVLATLAVERAAEIDSVRTTLLLTGVAGLPMLIVFAQPDLGTAMVYAIILVAVLFLAGAPWHHFAAAGAGLVMLVAAVLVVLPSQDVNVLKSYQVERLTAFAGADRDTSDSGYQLDQSKTAIGSGGALGKGPDGATQAINDFLPEHHTDFIFAVTSEMFGFVGGGGLILLYGFVIWRGLRAVARASSRLDQMIAGGVVAMLVFQVFVNIGMTVGIMPITGIPLPLMSFGGSHTLTTFAALGLLLGVYQRRGPIPS